MKVCEQCGAQLDYDVVFCNNCGSQQRAENQQRVTNQQRVENQQRVTPPQQPIGNPFPGAQPSQTVQLEQKEIKNVWNISQKTLFITMSIVMIVFFGFIGAVSASASLLGFSEEVGQAGILDYILGGEDLPFNRFVGFLMFLIPIVLLVKQFQPSLFEKFTFPVEKICCWSGIVLFVLFVGSLPTWGNEILGAELSPGFGTILYLICDIVGLVYLNKAAKITPAESVECPVVEN